MKVPEAVLVSDVAQKATSSGQRRVVAAILQVLRAAQGLLFVINAMMGRTAETHAWIAGTRTVGRVIGVRVSGSVRFEGVRGLEPHDTYLDATWQLLD